MRYVVTIDGREVPVMVAAREDGAYAVTVDGVTTRADLRPAGGASLWSALVGGRSVEVSVVAKDEGMRLTLRGATLDVRVESEQLRNARELTKSDGAPRAATVKASMPGIVRKVLVRPGEVVAKGAPLLIVEAMKMENEVRADGAGTVAEILVSEGRTVNGGDVLVRISAS